MKQLTNEDIAAFDAIGFYWTAQEYVTRSFDERIEDLEEYKRTHGHVNVNRNKDNCLGQFCANVRYARKQVEKDGKRKLTEEQRGLTISASSGKMHLRYRLTPHLSMRSNEL